MEIKSLTILVFYAGNPDMGWKMNLSKNCIGLVVYCFINLLLDNEGVEVKTAILTQKWLNGKIHYFWRQSGVFFAPWKKYESASIRWGRGEENSRVRQMSAISVKCSYCMSPGPIFEPFVRSSTGVLSDNGGLRNSQWITDEWKITTVALPCSTASS